jgi:group II intron reverse transcriptase/maturase
MTGAKTLDDMSPGLLRVMERARRDPHERQFSLAYLIDVEALRRAHGRIRKNAAVGVDGVTKKQYGQDLEANLADLHKRLRAMKYRHLPIRRVHIPKYKGRTRPIGISCLEDKIVQGALTEILGAIYEQEFLDGSYGFRPRRSPHDALRALFRAVREGGANVIFEADVTSFFDTVHRRTMLEMLEKRIADKSFMRLVGKCLHVGVLEGQVFTRPDEGTVQGSIISPMLGNIYLHNVLDKWFEEQVKPRLRGKATLIRYCDDFIIGFERMDDAERVRVVLDKRFERYHLSLHPDKTRLIDFSRPPLDQKGGKGPGNFDFLGFTVYWRRNHRGPGWHVACKTRKARLGQAIRNAYDFCRRHRHEPIAVQHRALVSRIRGHLVYFGVNDNQKSLKALVYWAQRAWHKWLNRRGQRARLSWERFNDLLLDYPLPQPRLYVNLWTSP